MVPRAAPRVAGAGRGPHQPHLRRRTCPRPDRRWARRWASSATAERRADRHTATLSTTVATVAAAATATTAAAGHGLHASTPSMAPSRPSPDHDPRTTSASIQPCSTTARPTTATPAAPVQPHRSDGRHRQPAPRPRRTGNGPARTRSGRWSRTGPTPGGRRTPTSRMTGSHARATSTRRRPSSGAVAGRAGRGAAPTSVATRIAPAVGATSATGRSNFGVPKPTQAQVRVDHPARERPGVRQLVGGEPVGAVGRRAGQALGGRRRLALPHPVGQPPPTAHGQRHRPGDRHRHHRPAPAGRAPSRPGRRPRPRARTSPRTPWSAAPARAATPTPTSVARVRRPRATPASSTARPAPTRANRLSLFTAAPMWASCGTHSGNTAATVPARSSPPNRRTTAHASRGSGTRSSTLARRSSPISRSSDGRPSPGRSHRSTRSTVAIAW